MSYAHALAWPSREACVQDEQAQVGHSKVEEWVGGENRAEVGRHLQKDGLYYSNRVLQFDVRGIQCEAKP